MNYNDEQSESYNTGDTNQYIDSTAKQVSDSAKNKVVQGFKSAGRGLLKNAYGPMAMGKKVVTDIAGSGLKIMLKKYFIIGVIIIVAVFIGGIFLMSLADYLIEERGTTQNYSLENEEMNVSGLTEDGVRMVVALTEPQALKTAYYRLMSCASYVKLANNQHIKFYDPEDLDITSSDNEREDFSTLQDYYEKEKNFLLSADFLLMADEILHDYTVYYPEQIIKPVFYKEDDNGNLKTQELVKEDETMLSSDVESVGYKLDSDGDFIKDDKDNKVNGLWDYGLGSVLKYTVGQKDVWMEGTIVAKDILVTNKNGEVTIKRIYPNTPFLYKNIPLKGEKDIKIGGRTFHDSNLQKTFGNSTTTYPIKIPLISSVALFSGSVSYEYEDKTTSEVFVEGTTEDMYAGVTDYIYGYYEGTPLYEIRSGSTFTKVPEQVAENKDPIGFSYIDDYYDEYTNYVPIGLVNDLDFSDRAEKTYDLLVGLGLLKPYSGSVGGVQLAPETSLNGSDSQINDADHGGSSDPNQWNELTMLAHLIAAEAADDKLDELMVGAVVMNRVHSDKYPDTLKECIEQSGQYACYSNGSYQSKKLTDSEIASAKQVLSGEFAIPENVVFQAQFVQGSYTFMINGVHYYCTAEGDETVATYDRYDRVALTEAQLRALAEQLKEDDSENSNNNNENSNSNTNNSATPVNPSTGAQIGGAKQVEVTYYCPSCNSPAGSYAVAWSGAGRATDGITCALSPLSRKALGVEYGDWIYISGIGTRRVDDYCGTGLGQSIKGDRIVVDIFKDTPTCVCTTHKPSGQGFTAYKTDGQGSTTVNGFSDNGVYYVDINNPYGFKLFNADNFDTLSATNLYEQFKDPNRSWFTKLFEKIDDVNSGFLNKLKDMLDKWGLMKGLNSIFNEDAIFTKAHFFVDPDSDTERTRDVVYNALAITQNKKYSEVISSFDENNMDLLFVGDSNGLGGNFGIINGVGTTVDGFISPTASYYQPIKSYTTSSPYVQLATPADTEVLSISNGTVKNVSPDGKKITIDFASGGDVYTIIYGNVIPSVNNGSSVSTGQVIGIATADGLTIQVSKNGTTVDPMSIFYQPVLSGGGIAIGTSEAVAYWPAPSYTRISSPYGNRYHPISGSYKFHKGVDLAAPGGSPCIASGSGTVIRSDMRDVDGYGNYIVIDHGNGVKTGYAHLKARYVQVGDTVVGGQQIGEIGTTGASTGNHLHFEVYINGSTVDPMTYFPTKN